MSKPYLTNIQYNFSPYEDISCYKMLLNMSFAVFPISYRLTLVSNASQILQITHAVLLSTRQR